MDLNEEEPEEAAAAAAEEVNDGLPTPWQLPEYPLLIRDLRLDIVVSRLGYFKFKGSPDPLAMVNVSIASLIGRT